MEPKTMTLGDVAENAMLDYFIELAVAGRHRHASSGEQAAHVIAKTLAEHTCKLDYRAFAGLLAFASYSHEAPTSAEYSLIR